MSTVALDVKHAPPLEGALLWVAAAVLALANFVAVLNMTIANVTVPNIAGALGAGSSQGTWVITSYAVAEAITVPLTGWLSARFGAVRLFCLSVMFFGVCSLLCGMSTSLFMLLGMRVLQGMAGGPLMALSHLSCSSQVALLSRFGTRMVHYGCEKRNTQMMWSKKSVQIRLKSSERNCKQKGCEVPRILQIQ
jgi:MFS family permease